MEREAATAAARTGGASPRRTRRAPHAHVSGAGTVALPSRLARAPFARAARARTGSVLDALLRGRGWIALIGALLVGIVFFNVDLLRLNREIARTAERSSQVRRQNAELRLRLARLGSSERLQPAVAAQGFVLPPPGEVHYLRARPSLDARNAAKRLAEQGDSPTPAPQPGAPAR
jgi:hypothetical protein